MPSRNDVFHVFWVGCKPPRKEVLDDFVRRALVALPDPHFCVKQVLSLGTSVQEVLSSGGEARLAEVVADPNHNVLERHNVIPSRC